MARRKEKEREKAIELRKQGMSYSQIKKEVDVSKGTLSRWLQDYPLSDKRIRELRDNNPKRIERFRKTMKEKRESEFQAYFDQVSKDIDKFSERDKFIGGLFLYWAEGGKTRRYTISLTNTDPAMLTFFIDWLKDLGVAKNELRARLHLYSDMDKKRQTRFWVDKLGLYEKQFQKPHIKSSRQADLSYKTGVGEGTCTVFYHGKEVAYYIHQGLKYLREQYN